MRGIFSYSHERNLAAVPSWQEYEVQVGNYEREYEKE